MSVALRIWWILASLTIAPFYLLFAAMGFLWAFIASSFRVGTSRFNDLSEYMWKLGMALGGK